MTLGVAFTVVGAVLGAGFIVQRAVLPTPPPAAKTALRAATWFQRHRLVESEFTLRGGSAVRGRCLQDWFTVDGRRRRGTALRLSSGFVLLAVPPHTLEARGGTVVQSETPPLVLLELGGCPRVLARRLATLATQRGGLVQRGNVLSFTLKGTRLVLTLQPHTDLPVSIGVVARGMHMTSRIRFTTVTTRLRHELFRGLAS